MANGRPMSSMVNVEISVQIVNIGGKKLTGISVYGDDEDDFPGTLFHSILMKRGWRACPNSWTGMFAAFNAGFDKDATRRSQAR